MTTTSHRVPATTGGTRKAGIVSAAAAVRAAKGWPPCAAGCGWPLDPAAAAGHDGTPGIYDRHPGCDSPPHPRLIQGGQAA